MCDLHSQTFRVHQQTQVKISLDKCVSIKFKMETEMSSLLYLVTKPARTVTSQAKNM